MIQYIIGFLSWPLVGITTILVWNAGIKIFQYDPRFKLDWYMFLMGPVSLIGLIIDIVSEVKDKSNLL